jgi:hypothetical protein
MSEHGSPGPPQVEDFPTIREFVEAAREYHEQTGVWPPDPLLDEVAEMRRQIMAEHDNDWRKVLDWYLELDKQRASTNGHPQSPVAQEQSEGVSGR